MGVLLGKALRTKDGVDSMHVGRELRRFLSNFPVAS